jgi:hypothetical protein
MTTCSIYPDIRIHRRMLPGWGIIAGGDFTRAIPAKATPAKKTFVRLYTPVERWNTATHESCHAVCAAVLGIRFECILCYIGDDGSRDYRGRVVLDTAYLDKYPAHHAIAVLSAPQYATRLYRGPQTDFGASADGEDIARILARRKIPGVDIEGIGRDIAKSTVRLHHRAIEKLAHHLMTYASASESEVKAIVAGTK